MAFRVAASQLVYLIGTINKNLEFLKQNFWSFTIGILRCILTSIETYFYLVKNTVNKQKFHCKNLRFVWGERDTSSVKNLYLTFRLRFSVAWVQSVTFLAVRLDWNLQNLTYSWVPNNQITNDKSPELRVGGQQNANLCKLRVRT